MSDNFVGEIRPVAFSFAPVGWAFCDGGILPISQNTALFSLLGTNYGGNGKSTFALPDLQGRVPIGVGQGSGLSDRVLGVSGGEETLTLIASEMPAHSHAQTGANASSAAGNTRSPAGAVPALESANITNPYRTGATADASLPGGAAGGGQAHSNMQPYLAISYIIALQGVFPSRP